MITMDTTKTTIFDRSCEATITKLLVNVGISSFMVRKKDMMIRVVSLKHELGLTAVAHFEDANRCLICVQRQSKKVEGLHLLSRRLTSFK